jgi:hypothetical protein
MSWLGQGTPANLMGFMPGSDPRNPTFISQPSEGLQVSREKNVFEGKQADLQRGFQAGQSAADRAQQSGLLAAQLGFQGAQGEANRGLQAQLQESQQGFAGQQAGAQREFTGQQNAAERSNQLAIASMPWDFKRQVFGTVSPILQGLLAGSGGPGGNGSLTQGAGVGAPPPPPTTGASVWDPAQVNAQVNDAKSQSAQAAASQMRQNATRVSGQGFGSNSPLLAALNNQTQAARMAGDSSAELSTRLNASQANANLGVEQAKVNAQNYGSQQDALARQRQATLNYQSSLVAALMGGF